MGFLSMRIHPGFIAARFLDKVFDDKVYAGAGNDRIYARDTNGVDFIACGAGFDKVETIHRDDRTLSNCERALGPRQGDI
jgi:hypothetical protein